MLLFFFIFLWQMTYQIKIKANWSQLNRGLESVFNATFNNISGISWGAVLLVEETGENHRPAESHWQTLSHNVIPNTPRLSGIRTHNFSGDCIDCKCSCQGRIQDFKLGGPHFKKLRRAEGGAKICGYFVWKKTILRQQNHIFSNFRDPPLGSWIYNYLCN